MKLRGLFVVAFAVSALFSTSAFAQQKAAAEALFRSGREAAQRGDWVTACDRFSASNDIDSTPGTILNLARCREELGQIASAWARYQEAAEKLPAGDRRRALALQRAAALEPRLPRVTLSLPSAPEGTVIEQNGSRLDVDALGVPLPVDPGKQTIVVQAPGHESRTIEFQVSEGEKVEKVLELGPKQSAHPSERGQEPDESSKGVASSDAVKSGSHDAARTWGYVAGGVGVVGVGVGTVMGLLTMQANDTVEANCPLKDGNSGCNDDGLAAAQRGKTYSAASTIGFSVGLVGLGVGTYLLFIREDGGKTQVAFRPAQNGATIEVGGTL